MERLKNFFMMLSLGFIAIGFVASIWLYSVLHDTLSLLMMAIFLIGLIWYGFNVKNLFKST